MNRRQLIAIVGSILLVIGTGLPWIYDLGYEEDGIYTGALGLFLLLIVISSIVLKAKPDWTESPIMGVFPFTFIGFILPKGKLGLGYIISNVAIAAGAILIIILLINDTVDYARAEMGAGIYVSVIGALLVIVGSLLEIRHLPKSTPLPPVESMKVRGDADGLVFLLDNQKDWMIRLDAAEALAQMGDKRGMDYLHKMVENPDSEISDVAKEILEGLTDHQPA